jgi:(R,R)-butanediol dehydrogenase/meso-butanediol dehydrogenase/diacetyl reductase
MKNDMNALLYKGKNELELGSIPIPEPGIDEVLIKVSYAGICGTDIHIYHGKHPRAKGPLVMGHEFCGEIVKCPESSELNVGDFVTAEPLISCGTCFTCLSGHPHVCKTLGLYGIDANGAFAEYVTMPVKKVYKIPKEIKRQFGALIEPIAVAIHALRISNLKISDTVCILGGGPIGLLLALTSKAAGCKDVIICEMNSYRLELAKKYGITTVDVSSENSL